MIANLTPSYQLTSEHPASRGGIPILLHRPSGQAHVPTDVLEPFPSVGLTTAAAFVVRYSKRLQEDELAVVDDFLRQWPEGPQLNASASRP